METTEYGSMSIADMLALKRATHDLRPVCGADRDTLKASLKEAPIVREMEYGGIGGCVIRRHEVRNTDNFTIAKIILANCPECRQALGVRV